MREIIFRVFDRVHKVCHILGTNQHDYLDIDYDGSVAYGNYQNGDGSRCTEETMASGHDDGSGYFLMQFSGTYDESGLVKVFEHDIIEATYNDDVYIGVVSFGAGMFIFCNKDLPDSYIPLNDLVYCSDDDQFSIEAKILGNIHTTPELLEVAK